MRRLALVIMSAVALAAVVLLLLPRPPLGHFGQKHYVFTSRFDNVAGLRPGAKVSLAGVELGSVRSVKPRPEYRNQPVEVVMDVWTDKDISIPSDSVVSVQTAGVFGEAFLSIGIQDARAGPADSKAFLQSAPTQVEWKEALKTFGAGLRDCKTSPQSGIEAPLTSAQEKKPTAPRQ